MGDRVKEDSVHNIFVNTQGKFLNFYVIFRISSKLKWNPIFSGKAHTNLHTDLHVEHCNLLLKDGIKHAGGIDIVPSTASISTTTTSTTTTSSTTTTNTISNTSTTTFTTIFTTISTNTSTTTSTTSTTSTTFTTSTTSSNSLQETTTPPRCGGRLRVLTSRKDSKRSWCPPIWKGDYWI